MAEERAKPRALFVEEAIQLALESRWADAVGVNHALIEKHGPDEDAFNRLGKALSETGDLQGALEAYSKSLELNPLNVIAQKNTKRLAAQLEGAGAATGAASAIDVDLFTEEPGKSALSVLRPPSGGVDVTVRPGDAVDLAVEGSAIRARTVRGVDLGTIDTKIARRLIPLIQSGNRYSAVVARSEDSRIEVILREIYQAPANARKSSFPIARGSRREEFRPYAKESLLATRGADMEALHTDEEDVSAEVDTADDDEYDGMQQVEGDLAEAATPEPDDEGSRPEDSY